MYILLQAVEHADQVGQRRVDLVHRRAGQIADIARNAGADRDGLLAAHVEREVALQVDELRDADEHVVGGRVNAPVVKLDDLRRARAGIDRIAGAVVEVREVDNRNIYAPAAPKVQLDQDLRSIEVEDVGADEFD